MLSKKIVLSAALISMAGFVACGDDSSSNSGSNDTLPEKVYSIQAATSLKCDESVKCAKVFVEDGMVNDYFQCDGTQWQPATDPKFTNICSTEGEKNPGSEDQNANNVEGKINEPESSASNTNPTSSEANSSDSNSSDSNSSDSNSSDSNESLSSSSKSVEMVSCDLPHEVPELGVLEAGCIEFEKGDLAASALSLRCEDHDGTLGTGCPAKQENKEENQEAAGPTGDLVSCHVVVEGVFGEEICDEVTKANEAALQAQCDMLEGTMSEGGCKEGYLKKCPSEKVNHYIYSESSECPTFT